MRLDAIIAMVFVVCDLWFVIRGSWLLGTSKGCHSE